MGRSFAIDTDWPSHNIDVRGEFDATFCGLRITVDDKIVTAFRSAAGQIENKIEAPGYHLAEWIAENWWALLWEPRKNESDGLSEDYASRHEILAAQHGFPLPNLLFMPSGEIVQVSAKSRHAKHADVRFVQSAEAFPKRAVVEAELQKFVDQTVNRLGDISGTPLQEAWKLVRQTGEEESEFCRLIGALGLSPYDPHPNIERALDAASEVLSPGQLLDLCLSSSPESVVRSAYLAGVVHKALDGVPEIDLSALAGAKPPVDRAQAPAYRAGYQAAHEIRRLFSVKEHDVHGASKVFNYLSLDQGGVFVADTWADSPVTGAVEKHDWRGKYALVPTPQKGRKFAMARAAYFLWTGGPDDCRMLTNAATRDQQAGRAFAAELLVPQAFIRRRSQQGKLQHRQIVEIAEDAGVATDLVSWQAKNNGLDLSR